MSLYSEQISILTSDFKRVRQEVTRIGGGVTTVSENLELSLRGQTDPVGDYFRLEEELQQDPSKRWNAETRKSAEVVFRKLLNPNSLKHQTDSGQSSDPSPPSSKPRVLAEVLYNASGIASELNMVNLSSQLAIAANAGRNTPEHEARMYRAMIQAEEIDPEEGFNRIVEIIKSLNESNLYSVHYTLSEAYNAAISTGNMRKLIPALQNLKTNLRDEAPSYISMLQAEAGLRVGTAREVNQAIDTLREGLQQLALESPTAWWMAESVASANNIVSALNAHPTYREDAQQLSVEFGELLGMNVEEFDPVEVEGAREMQSLLEELQSVNPSFPPVPATGVAPLELEVTRVIGTENWEWFEFIPRETGRYTISVTAGRRGDDPIVVVKDLDNELLGYDDDSGGELNALLQVYLERGESYAVGAGSAVGASIEGASVKVEASEWGRQYREEENLVSRG